MIASELREMAANRIKIEMRERKESFASVIGRITGEWNARHVLHSSGAQGAIAHAIAGEYQVRAAIIWQVLGRVIGTQGRVLLLDPSFHADLKNVVVTELDEHCTDLQKHYQDAENLMPASRMRPLAPSRQHAIDKIASEIDLSLLAARAAAQQGDGATTINVYQSYSIVQTGAESSAVLTVQLGPSERAEIDRALDATTDALREAQHLSQDVRGDLQHMGCVTLSAGGNNAGGVQ